MQNFIKTLLIIVLVLNSLISSKAENKALCLDTIKDYKGWGWEALVIKNEFITVAIVPSMGGNILQYDFGVDTFLLLNPETFGRTYTNVSGPFDGSWGFGGFQIWPAPESWPPPPYLTYLEYSYIVTSSTLDSVVIQLKSEKETGTFPGLQFERKISVYKSSTRVKIENTIINHNSSPVNYGMMNVTEAQVNHENLNDYENFSAYFPLNQSSKYGKEKVTFKTKSTAFTGELQKGIFAVDYKPSQGKVYADVEDGWASFVDKRDNQAYIRVFDIFEGENYPDNGARIEIYIEDEPQFMAIEVISPLKELAANGGKYTFVDNLYSTKLGAPIYKANHAGAVMKRLNFDSITSTLTGKYGVFSSCSLELSYYDKDMYLLDVGDKIAAEPDTTFVLNLTVSLPNETNYIKLSAYNINNEFINILDYKDFSEKEIVNIDEKTDREKTFMLLNNTITNGNRNLNYQINNSQAGNISIVICDFSGKYVASIYDSYLQPGIYNWQYNLSNLKNGIYLVVFNNRNKQICEKLVIIE